MEHHGLVRLRLQTPRLLLRLPEVDELRALAALAQDGVHPPDQMPFLVPWTDHVAAPSFVDDFVAYHLAQRNWESARWNLEFGVWSGAELIGVQAVDATDFPVRRCISTGSWLGRRFQRQGFGTEMRTAVLAFVFDGLGAVEARSGAFADNVASAAVSLKLGYRELPLEQRDNRGAPAPHRSFSLTRADWDRANHPPTTMAGIRECRRALGVPCAVDVFLRDLTAWARARSDVRAVALVGSHARGTARAGSDVDVLILTTATQEYIERDDWMDGLGDIAPVVTRQWGVMTERRLALPSGVEIDFGVATPSWARVDPLDPGTARVVGDGMVALHDPDGLLARLPAAL